MHFLLAYASRSRPELFHKRVANWSDTASGANTIEWQCSFDSDDTTMNTPAVQQWCQSRGIQYRYSHNHGKVEAINAAVRDVAVTGVDIFIIVSDDMACVQQGWDAVVAEDMRQAFPDLNGALWYPDGVQKRTCTLSIMGRRVYEELGHLYNPAFESVYCDNYYHEIMSRSGRLRWINKPLFHHEWRKDNDDALMKRNERPEVYRKDKAMYDRLMAVVERHLPVPGQAPQNKPPDSRPKLVNTNKSAPKKTVRPAIRKVQKGQGVIRHVERGNGVVARPVIRRFPYKPGKP